MNQGFSDPASAEKMMKLAERKLYLGMSLDPQVYFRDMMDFLIPARYLLDMDTRVGVDMDMYHNIRQEMETVLNLNYLNESFAQQVLVKIFRNLIVSSK